MIDFSITNIGMYTRPETHTQIINGPWLAFYVSGLKHSALYHPDGRLIDEKRNPDPFFRITLPGMKTSFECVQGRENWVIMLKDIPLRYSSSGMEAEIKDGESWIPLPLTTPVQKERVPGWQAEMKRIQAAFMSPVPRNILSAKLGVLNIFRYIVNEQPVDTIGESPADKLKRLIDEDSEFARTLTDLSEECSFSRDHLRILFKEKFQMAPNAYRSQRRMARIMELISGSSLSIKEIAAITGFEHSSHLCMAFKKNFGTTPAEAVRLFRYLAGKKR